MIGKVSMSIIIVPGVDICTKDVVVLMNVGEYAMTRGER